MHFLIDKPDKREQEAIEKLKYDEDVKVFLRLLEKQREKLGDKLDLQDGEMGAKFKGARLMLKDILSMLGKTQ